MRRVASVWLKDWPITVWSRHAGRVPATEADEGGQPFALTTRLGSRGLVLHALNPAARAFGLTRGQSHADARAILPALDSAPADLEADHRAMTRLALWAERWSPQVALDQAEGGREGLFLDMTGGTHLFGGDAGFVTVLRERLARAGVPARVALADTPGAAWALARYGLEDGVVAPMGEMRATLASLPVEALRLDPASLVLLRRLGLHRIGDLYGLPRSGLARRFRGEGGTGGQIQGLVLRLDQALGLAGEAVTPVRPAPRYRSWQAYAEPITDIAGVELRVPELAESLAADLARMGRGARRLRLTGFRVDGATTALEIGLARPSQGPVHILRLLRETGIERLDLGFGIDALMLSAVIDEPMEARQGGLDGGGDGPAAEALAGLLDRLTARLGEGTVGRPVPVESWLPERAERLARAEEDWAETRLDPARAARPVLLFDPPERIDAIAQLPDGGPAQFTWRRVRRRVVRVEGPERLAPEWWRPNAQRKPALTRDYYRVEDEAGHRFWLFRAGLYGVEAETPGWWMHGVFP